MTYLQPKSHVQRSQAYPLSEKNPVFRLDLEYSVLERSGGWGVKKKKSQVSVRKNKLIHLKKVSTKWTLDNQKKLIW